MSNPSYATAQSQPSGENLKVFVRVRPALQREFKDIEGFFHCVSIPQPQRISLQYPRDSLRNFDYSYIFDEKTTQREVF